MGPRKFILRDGGSLLPDRFLQLASESALEFLGASVGAITSRDRLANVITTDLIRVHIRR